MLSVSSRRDAQLQRVSKGPFWKWWSVALLSKIATDPVLHHNYGISTRTTRVENLQLNYKKEARTYKRKLRMSSGRAAIDVYTTPHRMAHGYQCITNKV